MTKTLRRISFSTLTVIVLLTACLPAQPVVTPDPAQQASDIATSVALTISAINAQTQTAQPIATNTTLPTQTSAVPVTDTPIIPTATPFVLLPPTATVVVGGGGGGGGGGSAPQPALDCTPINNKPQDLTVFHKGNEFDIKWTIKNTGTKTIPAKLDVKYLSGTVLMKDPTFTFVELPEIKPGKTATIIIDAIAPAKLGKHVMTWVVEGNMCYPYIAIIVE